MALSIVTSATAAAPAALPGALPTAAVMVPENRADAEKCLAQAISYEAGNQLEAGQEAVAQVVLNRLHHPAFPKTVCEVVFQGSDRRTGCQFTFTCDGSLVRHQPAAVRANAARIARLALDGQLVSPVADATHYHAFYVTPAWAAQLIRVGRIGAHIFYAEPTRGSGAQAFAARIAVPRTEAPKEAVFSAWGLPTAVLVPTAGAIHVRAEPPASEAFTPPSAPRTADLPTR